MDSEDLSRGDPTRIARLLDVDPSPREAWSAEEIASIFRHQLAQPIHVDLAGAALKLDEAPALRALLMKSYADLIRDPQPSLEILELIRRGSKRRRANADGAVPPEIPTTLYFAAIVLSILRLGIRTTDLTDEQLKSALEFLVKQEWLDEGTRRLFLEGIEALAQTQAKQVGNGDQK